MVLRPPHKQSGDYDPCREKLTFDGHPLPYIVTINHLPSKISYLNFAPLEVVSRYRDPQLQVGQNY